MEGILNEKVVLQFLLVITKSPVVIISIPIKTSVLVGKSPSVTFKYGIPTPCGSTILTRKTSDNLVPPAVCT